MKWSFCLMLINSRVVNQHRCRCCYSQSASFVIHLSARTAYSSSIHTWHEFVYIFCIRKASTTYKDCSLHMILVMMNNRIEMNSAEAPHLSEYNFWTPCMHEVYAKHNTKYTFCEWFQCVSHVFAYRLRASFVCGVCVFGIRSHVSYFIQIEWKKTTMRTSQQRKYHGNRWISSGSSSRIHMHISLWYAMNETNKKMGPWGWNFRNHRLWRHSFFPPHSCIIEMLCLALTLHNEPIHIYMSDVAWL